MLIKARHSAAMPGRPRFPARRQPEISSPGDSRAWKLLWSCDEFRTIAGECDETIYVKRHKGGYGISSSWSNASNDYTEAGTPGSLRRTLALREPNHKGWLSNHDHLA